MWSSLHLAATIPSPARGETGYLFLQLSNWTLPVRLELMTLIMRDEYTNHFDTVLKPTTELYS